VAFSRILGFFSAMLKRSFLSFSLLSKMTGHVARDVKNRGGLYYENEI